MPRRSRSRERSGSQRDKNSKSRSKRRYSDSEDEFTKLDIIQYDPRCGQSIDQLINMGKIVLPEKPKEIPEPPPSRPFNKEILRSILSRKRNVLKQRHDSIQFGAKKDIPEQFVRFSHRRVCTDLLGLSTVKTTIHKLFRSYAIKLESEKSSNLQNYKSVISKLQQYSIESNENKLKRGVMHLLEKKESNLWRVQERQEKEEEVNQLLVRSGLLALIGK